MSKALTLWHPEVLADVPGCPQHIITRAALNVIRDFCAHTLLWTEKHADIDVIALDGEDIAFVEGTPDTITSTSTDFDIGFVAGQIINTSSVANPGPFTLAIVATNTLTLVAGDKLTDEDAGDNIYIGAANYALTSTTGEIVSIDDKVYLDNTPLTPTSEWELNHSSFRWQKLMTPDPTHYLMENDRYIRLVYCPNDAQEGALEVWVVLKPLSTATTVENFIYNDYMDVITDGIRGRLFRMVKQPWSDMELGEFYRKKYERDRDIVGSTKKRDGYVLKSSQINLRRFV